MTDNEAEPEPGASAAENLDDQDDRAELRDRYYGLLQELRVVLPGVQVLVAFLFTAPFASGFGRIDETGRILYGVALLSGLLAVVAYTTPMAFHRLGRRTSRAERLQWSIRMARAGLALLAASLFCGLLLVARIVYSSLATWVVSVVFLLCVATAWLLLPLTAGREHDAVSSLGRREAAEDERSQEQH